MICSDDNDNFGLLTNDGKKLHPKRIKTKNESLCDLNYKGS